MSESTDPGAAPEPEVPHEDELDVEGPNESAPGHHPDDTDTKSPADGD